MASLAFGCWVAAGAVALREYELVAFGAICSGGGLFIYAMDCALQRLLTGCIRPPEVLLSDWTWAGAAVLLGLGAGFAAPLYAS